MAEPTTFSLAGDFPKLDKAEWQTLAEAALKGAPVAKLVKRVGDLTIDPLYLADSDLVDVGWPGAAPFVRGTSAHRAPWDIKQVYRFARPTTANRAILTDLERGVTSVELHLDGACRTGGDERSTDLVGDGLALANIESLQTTLAGVYDELAPVGFSAGAGGGPAAAVLLGLAQNRGHDQKAYKTQLNLDPVGAWGAGDSPELSVHDGLAIAADVAGYLRAWPSVRATRVDGRIYHDAGADEVDELAAMLATGVAYLQAMTEAGLSVDEAARHVVLRTSLDADLFLNIAKLRALRQTWGRIVDAAGGRTQDIHIEATSSATMMTKRDPWVNMLRTTAACFAGAVGGAQTLHLRPFDEAVGLPNDLALRVARNTQIVLQSESHLDQVIDPAGGSWYVENITRQMAEAAWARFQKIQAEGGIIAALQAGTVQDRLDATWDARQRDIARRKAPITGVSEFPHLGEAPLTEREANAEEAQQALRDAAQRAPGAPTFATSAELGASTAAAVDAAQKGTTLHQLLGAWAKTSGSRPAPARIVEQRRRASGFEALRDASDAYHNQFGHRPAVVLAKLGPVAEHTARATYAKNFFEAGGIEAIDADPVATPADAEQLAKNYSQATFVVLCGADERYRAEGVVFAAALREWTRTYLAGRPSEQESELRQAGIDEFIHIGVDVLACLQNAHRLLKAGEAS